MRSNEGRVPVRYLLLLLAVLAGEMVVGIWSIHRLIVTEGFLVALVFLLGYSMFNYWVINKSLMALINSKRR